MANYDWAVARLLERFLALHGRTRRCRRRHRDCSQKASVQWSRVGSRGTAVLFRRRKRCGNGGCRSCAVIWYRGWRGGRARTVGPSGFSRVSPGSSISERLHHVIPSRMRRPATVEEIKRAQHRAAKRNAKYASLRNSTRQSRQMFCNQLCNKQTSDRPAYAYCRETCKRLVSF